MDNPNILDAINAATRIEVPVNSERLGAFWIEISKTQARQLMSWHAIQHMTVRGVNTYLPVQLNAWAEGVMRIG